MRFVFEDTDLTRLIVDPIYLPVTLHGLKALHASEFWSFREVCGSGAKKGVFLPCRRTVEASAGMDAEAQRTCSERRAGGPQRTAGDMAGTPPTHGKARWTLILDLETPRNIRLSHR